MRKMKKLVLLSISLFVAFVFAACSADSEDGMGASGMNEFSSEELQQIYQMQEDYGVSFDFPKMSDKPLPSMKEFEELCKFVASMNSSKPVIEKHGNSIVVSPKRILKTRAYNVGKETSGKKTYSGSVKGEGTINGPGYYCGFNYTVTWANVGDREKEAVVGYTSDINPPSDWEITYTGFTYSAPDKILHFTFKFASVSSTGYRIVDLKYEGSVSMAGKK